MLTGIIAVIIFLSILVLAHELGHFFGSQEIRAFGGQMEQLLLK